MIKDVPVGRGGAAISYLAELAEALGEVPESALGAALEMLLEVRAAGRRVYVLGNGGSAATASHLVCDLVKTARVPGLAPVRAFALADNAPLLTAWANDAEYARCFAEQVEALAEPGDLIVAISASGNSPNVLEALHVARERGARTIALVGFDGGRAAGLADLALHVPRGHYGLVEDAHMAIGHALTAALRAALLDQEQADANTLPDGPAVARLLADLPSPVAVNGLAHANGRGHRASRR